MSSQQIPPPQNTLDISCETSTSNILFKTFQNQLKVPEDDKQTINAISNLISVLQNKRTSRASRMSRISRIQIIQEKKSESSFDGESLIKNPSGKSIDFKEVEMKEENSRELLDEGKSITEISCNDSNKDKQSNRPKSKFAKLLSNFSVDEPHIITSSYKSFCSPSKSSLNMNSKASHPTNLLDPGNKVTSSKKELTSAGNLVEQYENESNGEGRKSNRSAFGNKSGIRRGTKKKTTFALPQKIVPQETENTNGISLYEEVVAKNFEVIDNLLRKLNKIYANQEEYENSLIEISQKLNKIETDNENIHHEFRTSHFMIDKKLNTITNEYSNIMHEMNILKKRFRDGGNHGMRGSRGSFFVGLQGNVQSDNESNINSRRKRESIRMNSKRCSGAGIRNSPRHSQRNSLLPVERRSSFSSENERRNSQRNSEKVSASNERTSNWQNLKGIDDQNLGRILLEQINESGSWQGSESEISYNLGNSNVFPRSSSKGNRQSTVQGSHKNQRSFDKSDTRRSRNDQRISIDNIGNEEIKVIKTYISNEVVKMSSNSQINKQTMTSIENTINKKLETLEEKVDEKFFEFRKEVIEDKIERKLRKSIIDEVEEKTIKKIVKDINSLKEELNQKINALEKRFSQQLEDKCDKEEVRHDLKEILESMNRKVNTLMDECYHKFAQRNQSKRAILFLEKKINKLIDTAHKFKNFEIEGDTFDNAKCLSCSKNVPTVSGGHHYTQSQPMLTQISCMTPQQKIQHHFGNEMLDNNSINDVLAHKRQVKFTEINNSNNYSSVSQIFEKKKTDPPESPKGIKKLIAQFEKPGETTTTSGTQALVRKLKNRQTVDSNHSVTSNLKSRMAASGNENRPTTSMNSSVHESKIWKTKATNILKKEMLDWRSKSYYKEKA